MIKQLNDYNDTIITERRALLFSTVLSSQNHWPYSPKVLTSFMDTLYLDVLDLNATLVNVIIFGSLLTPFEMSNIFRDSFAIS